MTGLLYCGCCGNVFYSQASINKGRRYKYVMCGRRQRYGTHICENTSYLNEQTILDHITRAMMAVLKDDLESIVQDAVKEAQKLLNEGETESQQVKADLTKADKEIARLMRLLRDPDLDESPVAKKAVIRQLGKAEAKRDRLNAGLGELLDGANHNSGQLLQAVPKALAEAEETLMNIRTPAQMNRTGSSRTSSARLAWISTAISHALSPATMVLTLLRVT